MSINYKAIKAIKICHYSRYIHIGGAFLLELSIYTVVLNYSK